MEQICQVRHRPVESWEGTWSGWVQWAGRGLHPIRSTPPRGLCHTPQVPARRTPWHYPRPPHAGGRLNCRAAARTCMRLSVVRRSAGHRAATAGQRLHPQSALSHMALKIASRSRRPGSQLPRRDGDLAQPGHRCPPSARKTATASALQHNARDARRPLTRARTHVITNRTSSTSVEALRREPAPSSSRTCRTRRAGTRKRGLSSWKRGRVRAR